METLAVINALNASLALAEQLLPAVKRLALSGEISAEQQGEVLARYKSLRDRADGQFAGPEWAR